VARWTCIYGHTQWVTGAHLQSGMTTTFPPNTFVPHLKDGHTYDVASTSRLLGQFIAVDASLIVSI
jgi:hypothetical protein